ncbi:MAG TPA: prepilin peptidase [Allosphingosinicella sp.]|nr:prepilin peptidase [Allosphingosinicella sp.]
MSGLPAAADAAWTALAFILGAAIGSFLATILVRWPQGRSVVAGRSACDKCGKILEPRDLVPILSWSLARGRCRSCGARIDRRHLAAEAGAAMIGIAAIFAHPLPLAAVTAILGWWLFLLAALDLEQEWLPDRLTWPLLAAGLVAAWGGFGPPLESRLIGAAAGFASLFAIAALYRALRGREGLGGGDPKLFAAIGAWLGWTQLPFVLVGAGLIGLAALLLKRLRGGSVEATDRLPLGTLMALAAWPIWIVIGR